MTTAEYDFEFDFEGSDAIPPHFDPFDADQRKAMKFALRRKVHELRRDKRLLVDARDGLISVGRPSLYRPEYCVLILIMGSMGYSKAEMIAGLFIDQVTWINWAREHRQFFIAVQKAQTLSLAWWEETGREGLPHGMINAALYAKCMAGRFPQSFYRERPQIDESAMLDTSQATTARERLLARLGDGKGEPVKADTVEPAKTA